MSSSRADVVVVGAGVTGLSIAAELVEAGLRVQIVARNLPTDLDSTDFCSPWAGASFAPYATNPKELAWEKRTFEYLGGLADSGHNFVRRTETKYGWNVEGSYGRPPTADFLPNWHDLSPEECPRGTTMGVGFTSLTINPPAYLSFLLSRLSSSSPSSSSSSSASVPSSYPIIRRRLPSLSSAFTYAPLIVNCTGLGSLSLSDVLDTSMYPGMGQTITVRAPLATSYISCKDPRADGAHSVGEQIYIIPRPASGGLVTLGGCFRPGDWCAHPDAERAERILKEAYGLCPLLAGHQAWREGGWKEVEVVSHNAGLRPCRKGGPRVEKEKMEGGVVIHAYGLASSGYQWSKGVGEYAAGLVLEHLGRARL